MRMWAQSSKALVVRTTWKARKARKVYNTRQMVKVPMLGPEAALSSRAANTPLVAQSHVRGGQGHIWPQGKRNSL